MTEKQDNFRKWTIVGAMIAFLVATSVVFALQFDSNLIHFRGADEGVWLDPTIFRSEHGLLPQAAKQILGENQTLFAARAFSLLCLWIAFGVLGWLFACQYSQPISLGVIVLLLIGLVFVWLHPQVLLCSSRASSGCLSILSLSISLWGLYQVHHSHRSLNNIVALIGLALLSFSTPYGWSLGTALVLSTTMFLKSEFLKKLCCFTLPGLLMSNSTLLFSAGRLAPSNVLDNYFSSLVAPTFSSFGSAATFRILPFEFMSGNLCMAALVGVLILVLIVVFNPYVLRGNKAHALAIPTFLAIQLGVESFFWVPSIHYYLLSPFIFLILILPVMSAHTLRGLAFATVLLAMITLPSLGHQQFNSEQISLRKAAELANRSRQDGSEVIFCGTILYHAIYPWLDVPNRAEAKLCYRGAGFEWDKYFAGSQIDPMRRVESDYLMLNKNKKAIVFHSAFGQGLRVDIPLTWKKETDHFFFGDPEIESLYATKAEYQ